MGELIFYGAAMAALTAAVEAAAPLKRIRVRWQGIQVRWQARRIISHASH